jgi:hypothetical protein
LARQHVAGNGRDYESPKPRPTPPKFIHAINLELKSAVKPPVTGSIKKSLGLPTAEITL